MYALERGSRSSGRRISPAQAGFRAFYMRRQWLDPPKLQQHSGFRCNGERKKCNVLRNFNPNIERICGAYVGFWETPRHGLRANASIRLRCEFIIRGIRQRQNFGYELLRCGRAKQTLRIFCDLTTQAHLTILIAHNG